MTKLNFKTKLLLICLFMSLVSLLIGGVSLYGFSKFMKLSLHTSESVIPRSALIQEMDVAYQKTRIAVRTLGLSDLDEVNRQKAVKETIANVKRYDSLSEKLKQRISKDSKRELELYNELDKEWQEFKLVGTNALNLAKVYDQKSKEGLLDIFLNHCPRAASQYQARLDAYNEYINNDIVNTAEVTVQTTDSLNELLVLVIVSGILIGLVTSIIFSNRLTKNIVGIIERLNKNSHGITKNTNTIGQSSKELKSTSEEQNNSLHESSAALEEVGSMVKMTADNAQKSSGLAKGSLERASQGKVVVDGLIKSMNGINGNIDTMSNELEDNNTKIKQIAVLIKSIEEKTQLINDIVFQTKLLSFNASVEAARAGEAGKGFAVVAEEVGKLAQMSGAASVEIGEMIAASVSQVNETVKDSEELISRLVSNVKSSVKEGTSISHECEQILESIVESVETVSESVNEISNATQEQSKGIVELQDMIQTVDLTSKQNKNVADTNADISVSLQKQVNSMNESINDIKSIFISKKVAKKEQIKQKISPNDFAIKQTA